jgi:hypothetical protein
MDGKAQRLSEGIVNLFCRLFLVQRLRLGFDYSRVGKKYKWDEFRYPSLDLRGEAYSRTRDLERLLTWPLTPSPVGEMGVPIMQLNPDLSIH